MTRFLDSLRDHSSRIAGGLLLCAAFVTLLMAPPKPGFSIVNCYLFIGFVATGSLLLWGLWGPDPIATRLRRESRRRGPSPRSIQADVPERVFRYAPTLSWGRALGVVVGTLAGSIAIGTGVLVARCMPGSWAQRAAMGLPLWIGGGISLWFPWRQLRMYVRVDADGLECRGYFRTVKLCWEDVVTLIVREYYLVCGFGFLPVGIVYSVYSQRRRLSFLARLPDAPELANTISSATGLEWHGIDQVRKGESA